MKKIIVGIEGTSPLLMNNISLAIQEQIGNRTKRPVEATPSYEKEAEDKAYRAKSGELMIPARCIKAAILGASTWYKFKNRSAKQIIAGSTRIVPMEISLGVKDYEIDLRTVVIQSGRQRNRIVRARPRLDSWRCTFNIIYNEDMFPDTNILKEVVSEAGNRMGLLDNRPQMYGENGTFKITVWKVTNL